MPRRSKGARLQLKPARRNTSGKITHRATWIIRDNGRDISTGCASDEIAVAERKLKDYIASKYTPKRRVRHIDDIPVADALSIYLDAQLDKLRHRFAVDSEGEDTVPAIGPRIYAPRPQSFLPAMQDVVLSAAEATGREIDLAVRDLVEAGAVCARAILEKRRDDLDAGVPLPIARVTLTAEEFAPLRPVAVQEIEKATE